jgi:hypothetical protein
MGAMSRHIWKLAFRGEPGDEHSNNKLKLAHLTNQQDLNGLVVLYLEVVP